MHLFESEKLQNPTIQSFSGAFDDVGEWAANLGGNLRDEASIFAGNILQQGISRAQGSIDDLWSRIGANSNPDVGNTDVIDTGETGSGQPALDVDAIAAQQPVLQSSSIDNKTLMMGFAALLLILVVK